MAAGWRVGPVFSIKTVEVSSSERREEYWKWIVVHRAAHDTVPYTPDTNSGVPPLHVIEAPLTDTARLPLTLHLMTPTVYDVPGSVEDRLAEGILLCGVLRQCHAKGIYNMNLSPSSVKASRSALAITNWETGLYVSRTLRPEPIEGDIPPPAEISATAPIPAHVMQWMECASRYYGAVQSKAFLGHDAWTIERAAALLPTWMDFFTQIAIVAQARRKATVTYPQFLATVAGVYDTYCAALLVLNWCLQAQRLPLYDHGAAWVDVDDPKIMRVYNQLKGYLQGLAGPAEASARLLGVDLETITGSLGETPAS